MSFPYKQHCVCKPENVVCDRSVVGVLRPLRTDRRCALYKRFLGLWRNKRVRFLSGTYSVTDATCLGVIGLARRRLPSFAFSTDKFDHKGHWASVLWVTQHRPDVVTSLGNWVQRCHVVRFVS